MARRLAGESAGAGQGRPDGRSRSRLSAPGRAASRRGRRPPRRCGRLPLLAEIARAARAAAAEAYLALARRYPAADEAWRSYQAAGLIYFRLGDYGHAADTWREMAEQAPTACVYPAGGPFLAGPGAAGRWRWSRPAAVPGRTPMQAGRRASTACAPRPGQRTRPECAGCAKGWRGPAYRAGQPITG